MFTRVNITPGRRAAMYGHTQGEMAGITGGRFNWGEVCSSDGRAEVSWPVSDLSTCGRFSGDVAEREDSDEHWFLPELVS